MQKSTHTHMTSCSSHGFTAPCSQHETIQVPNSWILHTAALSMSKKSHFHQANTRPIHHAEQQPKDDQSLPHRPYQAPLKQLPSTRARALPVSIQHAGSQRICKPRHGAVTGYSGHVPYLPTSVSPYHIRPHQQLPGTGRVPYLLDTASRCSVPHQL